MPSGESSDKAAQSKEAPKTAFERYFWLPEEEKRKASPRPLTPVEEAVLNPSKALPAPRPLTEAERVHGAKVEPVPRVQTPFEKYYHEQRAKAAQAPAAPLEPLPPRPKPIAEPVRVQTTLERLYNVPKPSPPPPLPRPLTPLEKSVLDPSSRQAPAPKTAPMTPFERSFWMPEEEKNRPPEKVLTPIEKLHRGLIDRPGVPAEKPLTEVEKVHGKKPAAVEPAPREPTPFEKYFHAPKPPPPPPKPLTETEKLRIFLAQHGKSTQRFRDESAVPSRVVLRSDLGDIVISAGTATRNVYLPQERGIIQRPRTPLEEAYLHPVKKVATPVPMTPFEKYFWMSQEKRKQEATARPKTALEEAFLSPAEKPAQPAPQTPFEKYFHMPKPEPPPRPLTEVEKAYLSRSCGLPPEASPQTILEKLFHLRHQEGPPRPLTEAEKAYLSRSCGLPPEASPQTILEKLFHLQHQEVPPRPLTEVEKVHGTKAEAPRPRTALEQCYGVPKAESSRPLTDVEKIYGLANVFAMAVPPKPLTALEQVTFSRKAVVPDPAFDSCADCRSTGRITYPPDPRGIINRSACPRCEGRGRLLRKGGVG